jgi:EmrB/QacA subfamily drug resistance transporter
VSATLDLARPHGRSRRTGGPGGGRSRSSRNPLDAFQNDGRLDRPARGFLPGVDRRWWILVVLAIAQLMIVVDASIVNVALPSAQRALHISSADRQWVVTAYTLTFGGLLLLGGRIADYTGRKRALVIGLLGFAASSAIGGLAANEAMLFAARALQGAFAALMAPAALSLINVTFTSARDRARAFGVYGAISGGGLAIGLIAGGVLTQYVSWRWCLLVNIPISVVAATGAFRLIQESRSEGHTRYDVPGALTSTAGMVALVYGVTEASTHGWSAPITLATLFIAVALLAAFVVIESGSAHPLLPLRLVTERNRGGSYLTTMLVGMGIMGTFLFLTFYLQQTLHYSALRTGFSYLPFSVGIVTGAALATQLASRLRPRVVMGTGLLLGIAGMLWFTQIGVHSAYWMHIALAELVLSIGMGLVFVPVNSTALVGVGPEDSGVASALINSTQQIGGSIGTALLNTVATTATVSYIGSHGASPLATAHAAVHGYATAFGVGASMLLIALGVLWTLVTTGRPGAGQPVAEAAGELEISPILA